MKKVILPALVAVAAISGAFGYFNQPSASEPNALAVANLDALTDIELPDLDVECNGYIQGDCYTEDFLHHMVMCGEYMFFPCKFSGYLDDYCHNPC